MTPHLQRSRIAKAFTDRGDGGLGFDTAEQRLSEIKVAIIVGRDQAATPAGQAAALTAAATAIKCFGSAALVAPSDTPLTRPLPLGRTLHAAAVALGAMVVSVTPAETTHTVAISTTPPSATCFVRCWWDGWTAGVLPEWDEQCCGGSDNPLAGVFAGALAVREVFASLLGASNAGGRVSVASLWEPWQDPSVAAEGPRKGYLPSSLWFVGLGHLGQGFLWSLGLLPAVGTLAVLQDDQTVGEENEATGLLTTGDDVGKHKTRVAARWLEELGWRTALLERRNYGDVRLLSRDPAIVLTSIDEPRARADIAGAGFEYLIDAGVGHGPVDFEGVQIRILPKGADPRRFWSAPEKPKDVDALLRTRAYRAHAEKFDNCGTFTLAEASVAVPFVGAAAGALVVAQLLRLAAMQSTMQIMQMDLGSPALVIPGGMNDGLATSLGSVACPLDERPSPAAASAA